MADTDNSMVVYPDGRLFKCEHIEIGDEVGSIYSLEHDYTAQPGAVKYLPHIERAVCSDCPIYPSCILLKNCNGTDDYNDFTCKFNVESYEKSLLKYYTTVRDKLHDQT